MELMLRNVRRLLTGSQAQQLLHRCSATWSAARPATLPLQQLPEHRSGLGCPARVQHFYVL